MNASYSNPWVGLSAYEDPEKSEQKFLFCGRDEESYDLAKQIKDNIFITLYGKSGIGKTSLLNAGVFPELRDDIYFPISIRLGRLTRNVQDGFAKIIIKKIEESIGGVEVFDVIKEQEDNDSVDYLWNYFARHRFLDTSGSVVYPVVVLDQFEEVYRKHRTEAEILLRQIHFLTDKDHVLDDCYVEERRYKYECNFRFVVSIREDDLYRLEDSIDYCYLSALKRNRYRLRALSTKSAREVIEIPGRGLFNSEEFEEIVEMILSISRNKDDNSISTNLLSLICNRIYVDYKKTDASFISKRLVALFIEGNPFERFYNEATVGLSNRTKELLENNLITEDGRRKYLDERKFERIVPDEAKRKSLLEGDLKILQRISVSSKGDVYGVEFIHDSFCEPLLYLSARRKQRKKFLQIALVVVCVLFILAIGFFGVKLSLKNNELIDYVYKYGISVKIKELIDKGDSPTAALLCLEAFERDNISSSAYAEIESALRYANSFHNVIFHENVAVPFAKYSRDGKYVVVASWNHKIMVYDSKNGKLLKELEGHTSPVMCVDISPDNKRIVSCSIDKTTRMWNLDSGKQIGEPLVEGFVNSVVYSPDGKCIVSGDDDGLVKIWDWEMRKCLMTFTGHTREVTYAIFSPDGKHVVSSSGDATIRLWSVDTGLCKALMVGHSSSVSSVNFSNDGEKIVSASWDRSVKLWNANTGTYIKTIGMHDDYVTSASFSPDDSKIVSTSTDNSIKIWDVENAKCLQKIEPHANEIFIATYCPNKERILSAYDGVARQLVLNSEDCLQTLVVHENGVTCIAKSPDGSCFASSSVDSTIIVWDAVTLKRKLVMKSEGYVNKIVYSPDGKYIAAGLHERINIWDANTGKCVNSFRPCAGDVTSLAYSKDGRYLISAFDNGYINIWSNISSASDYECVKTLEVGSVVYDLALNPDNSLMVSCQSSDKEQILIWDFNTWKVKETLNGHDDFMITCVRFDQEGKLLASGSRDNTIRIWDMNTKKCIKTFVGHTSTITSLAFSQDRRYLMSSACDKTIKVWDIENGICVKTYKGHSDYVMSADFMDGDNRIVSASYDRKIKIWDFPPIDTLIERTRKNLDGRVLTTSEYPEWFQHR